MTHWRFNPFDTGQGLSTSDGELRLAQPSQFQSLWYRARSFDRSIWKTLMAVVMFQSLWYRARSFDKTGAITFILTAMFQSLWYRARSFDSRRDRDRDKHQKFQSLWYRARSFDLCVYLNLTNGRSFNPFDTGQGLSTVKNKEVINTAQVSIPLIQGKVFRLRKGLFFLHFNKLNNGFPKFLRSRRVSCWIDWKIINFIPSTCQKQRYFNKKHRTFRA